MYQSLIAEMERNRAAAAAAATTASGGPRPISVISNTVSSSNTVSVNDGNNAKRSRKLLRHMLEHAVVCSAPVRRKCGECLELRSALEDHAERCTRAACSMPFCGVSRGTMQAYLDNGGTTLNMTVTTTAAAATTTSLSGDNKVRIKVSPKPSPNSLDQSNDFLSASSMGKTQGSPRSSRQSNYLNALATQNNRQSPINDASSNDDDMDDNNNNHTGGTEADETAITSSTPNMLHNNNNNGPVVHSTVTMLGNFDGCSTYSGKWFMDAHPAIERPFGYVYRDEDVSDPDGSLPCAACGKVSPDSAAKFVVCDLCDQVFHLECANLDIIPEDSWFCSNCTRVRKSLLPTDSGSKVKLPPTRLWTGHFMFHDKKLSESFRLEFKWREAKDEQGVIADVSGKGKNVYGNFTISGKLSAPKPPKQSFPLELKKVYTS